MDWPFNQDILSHNAKRRKLSGFRIPIVATQSDSAFQTREPTDVDQVAGSVPFEMNRIVACALDALQMSTHILTNPPIKPHRELNILLSEFHLFRYPPWRKDVSPLPPADPFDRDQSLSGQSLEKPVDGSHCNTQACGEIDLANIWVLEKCFQQLPFSFIAKII